jgi:hypothetical protein
MIITSQVGFDISYANPDAYWGKAHYFAENASYSCNYSFEVNNSRKFFFAEIILGDIVSLPKGRYLKPPNKANSLEYDSIQGFTEGSDVYMVYSNQKCYPRYLVTYEPNRLDQQVDFHRSEHPEEELNLRANE